MDAGLSHAISESQLVEGDHIYAWRSALVYSHQGIYVGRSDDGVRWVIHFLGGIKNDKGYVKCPQKICCSSNKDSRPSGVSKTCLACFLQGDTLRRYQYNVSGLEYRFVRRGGTCTSLKADDPKKIVDRAYNLLQSNKFGHYNLFARNCESFALYCSTGELENATSNQVRHGIAAAAAGITVLTFGIGYALKSIYSYATREPEEENQEGKERSQVPALAM